MDKSAGDLRRSVSRIVVPSDFSDTADLALERGCELALQHAARIVLVHALNFQPTPIGGPNPVILPPDFGGQLRTATQTKLEALAERVRSRGIEVDVELTTGVPGASIVEISDRSDADLIVIGTRGLSGFKHLVLGSTAEQVVRRASCPVLTIHPDHRGPLGDLQTVIVPTELSEDPAPAVDEVLHFFGQPPRSARILLVYSDHLPAYLQPLVEDLRIDRVGFEEISGLLRERLEPTARRLEAVGFEVETVIREGDPASVITELASARGADLIAMETRGRSGLAHLLLGSTAERVVQHAGCPVLTVRRSPAAAEQAQDGRG